MKNRLMMVMCVAVAGLVLAGCSNSKVAQLETNMNELSNKVDTLAYQVSNMQNAVSKSQDMTQKLTELQTDVATAFSSSALAYDEAERANARLDNMAQSYTK